ncbi:outer membrane beta-barrel protein [uncultured Planktomarina sp.]|uniref:outer membrane beta-barrel protein n=1 Tax=uncultured Planktomarina sp. TaxID=1538529 RepID=UPI0032617486
MKHLIAALLTTIAFASSASAQNFTYEIYGGAALKDTSGLQYGQPGNDFAMAEGHALGVGAYTDLAGFEVGADFMITDRRYFPYQTGVESTSLMLNGRYPFQITNGVIGYAGLGLGVIKVEYDGNGNPKSGYYNAAGKQISLGARLPLGANEVFTEIKYQTVFKDRKIKGMLVEYNSSSFVIGFRF